MEPADLTFFDANQMAPTAYGSGGPPECMGSRMTWPSERDLRTLCIFGNIKETAPIYGRLFRRLSYLTVSWGIALGLPGRGRSRRPSRPPSSCRLSQSRTHLSDCMRFVAVLPMLSSYTLTMRAARILARILGLFHSGMPF